MAVPDMKKFIFLIYINTHQKSSSLSEIYVGVDINCSSKQWRNAKERFSLEILSWGQDKRQCEQEPPLILFLELVIIYPRKCGNRRIV